MANEQTKNTRTIVLDDHVYTDVSPDWDLNTIRQKIINDGKTPPDDLASRIFDAPVSTKEEEEENNSFSVGGVTYDPVEQDPNTWADYAPLLGELGTAIAAGSRGFAQGAKVGSNIVSMLPLPPQAKVGSAVLGGALGLAAVAAPASALGNFGGNIIEDYVEGTRFNPDIAMKQAWDAAQTGALWTAALGTAWPAGKAGASMLKKWFEGRPASDPKIEVMLNLQEKLKQMGASLFPTMVTPFSKKSELASSVANVSQVTKQTVKNYLDSYSDYMGGQIESLIKLFPSGSSRQHGENLQKLINSTDAALSEIVKPIYAGIDTLGKTVQVNARNEALDIAKKLRHEYRGEPEILPSGEKIPTYNWGMGGSEAKELVTFLENLPSNLTFLEAHNRISAAKKVIRDLEKSSTPNTNKREAYKTVIDLLQTKMDEASSKLSPFLKKEYDEVSAFYKKGKETITDTYLEKALDVNDPSQIGAMLTQDGFTVGIEQIKNLKKLAAEYQNRLSKESATFLNMQKQPDVLEGIRRGYLESMLKAEGAGDISTLKTFRNKLTDPKFKETFTYLFSDTAVPKKIDTLLDELLILERVEGAKASFSLAVTSQELGAARQAMNPTDVGNAFKILVAVMPGALAKRGISPESVDKQIQLVKVATEAAKRNIKLPTKYWQELARITGSPTSSLGYQITRSAAQAATPTSEYQ